MLSVLMRFWGCDMMPDMSLIVRAARGLSVPHTPVWFMRQAGRSLPEYRQARTGIPMMEACRTPELIAEITMQPVRRHNVDAAIFFSDIVVPLAAVGVKLDIKPGVGPVIENPIRSFADLAQLPTLHGDHIPYITAATRLIAQELSATPEKSLIGFAGAPFTLASYLVEGGPSKSHERTKSMMYGQPELWHALMERLAQISGQFLRTQVEAGAQTVQLFDSWVGMLPVEAYERFVRPYSQTALAAVGDLDVPRIHFGVGTGELLASMAIPETDVVGVDFRVDLLSGINRIAGKSVQGNLDPALLFAPDEVLMPQVDRIVAAGMKARGHIFNLGHGVLPSTNPDALTRVVERVHATSAQLRSQ